MGIELRIEKNEIGWETHPRRHKSSAALVAQAPPWWRYAGREMPSFFIFLYSVERFIPRRAAAPSGPPSTQPVSRRAPMICSRSASARLLEA